METNIRNSILSEYDDKYVAYNAFTEKMHHLVSEILNEKNLSIHSLNYRVKTRPSLLKKLEKLDAHYTSLGDITDISGIRIITYFSDEVDSVASLLKQEFQLDLENSIDKRTQLDPDKFGYLSLHYVVKLVEHRSRLVEYRRFPEFKAEIQIRSILQHAWAEIEHDLGYKTSEGIPKDIRRRFSRLAGILELADEEFLGIRKYLEKYGKDIPNKIANIPDRVIIDRDSLLSFVQTSELIKTLDLRIATNVANGIIKEVDKEYVERHVSGLKYFKIETIAELHIILEKYSERIFAFSKYWITDKSQLDIPKSVCIYYLILLLAKEKLPDAEILELFHSMFHMLMPGKTLDNLKKWQI